MVCECQWFGRNPNSWMKQAGRQFTSARLQLQRLTFRNDFNSLMNGAHTNSSKNFAGLCGFKPLQLETQ